MNVNAKYTIYSWAIPCSFRNVMNPMLMTVLLNTHTLKLVLFFLPLTVLITCVYFLVTYIILQRKCERYWPEKAGTTIKYGRIKVTTVTIENYADYTIRIFTVIRYCGDVVSYISCCVVALLDGRKHSTF